MNTFQRHHIARVVLFVGLILLCGGTSVKALSLEEQQRYAQRFCPYLKTSAGEHDWLCNWQWFVTNSTLVDNYVDHGDPDCFWGGSYDVWPDGTTILTPGSDPELLIMQPYADVTGVTGGVANGSVNMNYALHIGDVYRNGENNADAIYGCHGIYAHVEEVNSNIINIEYTMLWVYNDATCDYHSGDMTTMIVDYDRGCDLLTRVTYIAHGPVIMSYRLIDPWGGFTRCVLDGKDWNGNQVTAGCVAVTVDTSSGGSALGSYYQNCSDSDYTLSGPDTMLYLAQDPVTLRYEHPVVYAESNGHEFWPNPTGSLCYYLDSDYCANPHDGSGVSFLTTNVQVLGTLTNAAPGYEPFLFFNGRMGTVTAGIIFHRAWFWPEGRTNNPYGIVNRWTDDDPYDLGDCLAWPPPAEFNDPTIKYIMYMDSQASDPCNGYDNPFSDPNVAFSFVPKWGTLSVAAGTYHTSAPVTLSRACTITATGGAATITP